VRFQVLTAASMMFRVVFWDILPCKRLSTDGSEVRTASLMMEAVYTSETSVDNHFTRQYIPKDNYEQNNIKMTVSRILRHVISLKYIAISEAERTSETSVYLASLYGAISQNAITFILAVITLNLASI
jgi:hypothetical protein